jgi:hypothetical protein
MAKEEPIRGCPGDTTENVTLPVLQKRSGRAGVRVAMTGAMEQSAQVYHRDREGSIEHLLNIRKASWRKGMRGLLPRLPHHSHPGPVRCVCSAQLVYVSSFAGSISITLTFHDTCCKTSPERWQGFAQGHVWVRQRRACSERLE